MNLEEIERLAGLFMKPSSIAMICDLTPDQLNAMVNDNTSDQYKAYQKGKLLSEAELRKSVITMAKQGSSPAQTLASKLLDEMNMDELDI